MSVVTHIILHVSYGEDYTELSGRDGGRRERRYTGVEHINEWLDDPERRLGTLRFVNPHAGGSQTFSGAVFLGAFNYLDLDGLAERVKCFAWEEPEKIQLFVREDEDDTFWEYDLSGTGQRAIQDLIEHLAEVTKGGVDLRYLSGRWSVFVSQGNQMVIVPGSVNDDPLKSLAHCLSRWDDRSLDKPFL